MGDARSGISGALRELAEGAEPLDQAEAETADLFGDQTAPDWGSPLRGSPVFSGGSPAQKRKRGRPEGSRNLVTKEVVEKILARYPHPLIGMAEVAATAPYDLARTLLQVNAEGEERGRVTEEQLRWAYDFWFKVTAEFTEYVATKQPRQLMAEGGLPPLFQVFMGAPSVPGTAPAAPVASPQAFITNGSLTETQIISSTPLAANSSLVRIKLGTWAESQVGV